MHDQFEQETMPQLRLNIVGVYDETIRADLGRKLKQYLQEFGIDPKIKWIGATSAPHATSCSSYQECNVTILDDLRGDEEPVYAILTEAFRRHLSGRLIITPFTAEAPTTS